MTHSPPYAVIEDPWNPDDDYRVIAVVRTLDEAIEHAYPEGHSIYDAAGDLVDFRHSDPPPDGWVWRSKRVRNDSFYRRLGPDEVTRWWLERADLRAAEPSVTSGLDLPSSLLATCTHCGKRLHNVPESEQCSRKCR